MILPDDILRIIKEYSMPIGTRLDWRTCKRKESRRIKMSNRALTLWYKWLIGPGERALFNEVSEWTFYGRRHLIWESRRQLWTQIELNDEQWYEKRFMMFVQREGWPDFMTANYVELHMYKVSLIV
jgi:hypothetical protein